MIMKKIITVIICLTLVLSSIPITVKANQVPFTEFSVTSSYDENIDRLDASVWDYINTQENELKKQGYILSNERNNSPMAASDWTTDQIDGEADRAYWTWVNNTKVRVCIVDKLYTKAVVKDNKANIKNLLKIGYNVVIGKKTKMFWILSTAIGLDSKLIDSEYIEGDTLVTTEQKAYHYKYYKVYNKAMDEWLVSAHTTSVDVNVRAEYSTLVNTKPVLIKNAETSQTFYTQHYHDEAWLTEAVNSMSTTISFMAHRIDFFD